LTHAKDFRDYMVKEQEWCRDEVKAVWFKDGDGCYPAEYIGDDLLGDIIDKFYYPYAYLRDLLAKKYPNVNIYIVVMPSYEDHSQIVVYAGDRVLLTDDEKAWHFFFETDKDFDEWALENLGIIERKLQV